MNNARRFLNNERGVALPIAMLALIILSALVIGFSVLASTEPTIANNQLVVAQARSLAESGVEQAIWALNRGKDCDTSDPKAIPNGPASSSCAFPALWTAPAPYNGSQLVLVSTGSNTSGGFRVTVTTGASAAELIISSVGWVPNDTTTSPKAHQKIKVTVFNPQFLFKDPPAALSVRGDLELSGNSLIDSLHLSRPEASCGEQIVGTVSTGRTVINNNATTVWGAADSDNVANETTNATNGPLPPGAHDIVWNLATTSFDSFALTNDDINALRAYAKSNGTYLQGAVSFNANNNIPNGLVFIDTVSGQNITGSTPTSDPAQVQIQGNPPADPSGVFSGYLFVNGTLQIDGNFQTHGMIYAQNDLVYHGVGTGGVYGAVMSRNIQDQVSTNIDSDVNGNALINYDCAYAKTGGGQFKNQWRIESGTYKELCDSCS